MACEYFIVNRCSRGVRLDGLFVLQAEKATVRCFIILDKRAFPFIFRVVVIML